MSVRTTPAPRPPRRMKKPPSIHDKPKKAQGPAYKCLCTKSEPPLSPIPERNPEDGNLVCSRCFYELEANDNIVSEVTFSEDASGRATAQGGFVGTDARHANTMGPGARRLGGNDRDPSQNAAANAKKVLAGLCPRLNLAEAVKNQAVALYQLASGSNFSAGRRTEEVVAACLYAVCRRNKQNHVLLIDISELQRVNVFRLGEVYKALCKDVYIETTEGSSAEKVVGQQYRVEIESLITKYCRKLEFGDKTKQVAEDAMRIMRRMSRDWITTGRHPAGLCGACIIYAARMNNFRRTKREVVYVAKIADQTIAARMAEFQRTRAAAMSVDQFREKSDLLREAHDPPSFDREKTKRKTVSGKTSTDEAAVNGSADGGNDGRTSAPAEERASPASTGSSGSTQGQGEGSGKRPWSARRRALYEAKKRKRDGITDDATDGTANGIATSGEQGSSTPAIASASSQPEGEGPNKRQRTADGTPATPPPTQQEPRLDADGFAVPQIPASVLRQQQQRSDSEVMEVEPPEQPKKRGRKPKEFWIPSQEELLAEAELEREIQVMLDKDDKDDSLKAAQAKLNEDKARERTEEAQKENTSDVSDKELKLRKKNEENAARRAGYTIAGTTYDDRGDPINELVTAEDLEAEFANDPEVMNCLLPEKDQKIKEQIWVAENEDWMRVQVAKEIDKRLKAEERKDRKPGRKGKKDKGQTGDGGTLAEALTPANNAMDALPRLIEKQGRGVSKHLDYGLLKKVYDVTAGDSSASQSRDTSQPGSREPSVAPSETTRGSASPTPAPEDRRQQRPQASTAASRNAADGDGEQDVGEDEEGSPGDYVDEHDYGEGLEEEGDDMSVDDNAEEIATDEFGPVAMPSYRDGDDSDGGSGEEFD